MNSAIDPTKPADGVPAVKAELRENLQAAKSEIEALQAARLPTGGTVNQVLAKVSAADFHTRWVDQIGGGAATTAANVGEGAGVFKQKTGDELQFRSLTAGANMAINLVGDALQLVATATATAGAHFLDVKKDFAALANGQADDSAAINNALSAARESGQYVFFPAGHYVWNTPPTFPSLGGVSRPIKLVGECLHPLMELTQTFATSHGGATQIKSSAPTLLDLTGIDTTQNLVLSGIHFFGDGGNKCLDIGRCPHLSIEHCSFTGFGDAITVASGPFYGGIWHTSFGFNERGVVFTADSGLGGGVTSFNIVDCRFNRNFITGMDFPGTSTQSAGPIMVLGCRFEQNNGYGFRLKKVRQITFDTCYVESNNRDIANKTNVGQVFVENYASASNNRSEIMFRNMYFNNAHGTAQRFGGCIEFDSSQGSGRDTTIRCDGVFVIADNGSFGHSNLIYLTGSSPSRLVLHSVGGRNWEVPSAATPVNAVNTPLASLGAGSFGLDCDFFAAQNSGNRFNFHEQIVTF